MLNLNRQVKTVKSITQEALKISRQYSLKPQLVKSILKNELQMSYRRADRVNKDTDRPDVVENREIFKSFFQTIVFFKC